MAFSLVLQRNASESNKVDKDLTDIQTVTGSLKSECSIIDPVIMIAGDLASFVGCNYVTIPTFGRSYFIKNIESVRVGLVSISCHVDVLSSFKAGIRANKAIIQKQELDNNLYINDGSLKVYQNSVVQTKAFPNGFTQEEFVLVVACPSGGTQT